MRNLRRAHNVSDNFRWTTEVNWVNVVHKISHKFRYMNRCKEKLGEWTHRRLLIIGASVLMRPDYVIALKTGLQHYPQSRNTDLPRVCLIISSVGVQSLLPVSDEDFSVVIWVKMTRRKNRQVPGKDLCLYHRKLCRERGKMDDVIKEAKILINNDSDNRPFL